MFSSRSLDLKNFCTVPLIPENICDRFPYLSAWLASLFTVKKSPGADAGFFLGGRGVPLRNDVTDGEVKKKLKASTYIRRQKLHLIGGGGGVLPLHPPSSSAPVNRFYLPL